MQTTLRTQADNRLRDLVQHQLDYEPGLFAQDIAVAVRDGTVTLTGFVHSYYDMAVAERAAKTVYGVRAVANDIQVKTLSRTDPEIARDILEAFRIDTTIPDRSITLIVSNGLVTLEGSVDWNFQREIAEHVASKVKGVQSITNRIVLKPRLSTQEIQKKIEEALRRSAEVDARRITVLASDSTVTLAGNVRSFAERQEAEKAAWAAPGVAHVIDQISIAP